MKSLLVNRGAISISGRVSWFGGIIFLACMLPAAAYSNLSNPMSLDVKEAEIDNVLKAISSAANINVVKIDAIAGLVTVKVRDVPASTVLKDISQQLGLKYRTDGNVLKLYRADSLMLTRPEQHKIYKGRLISLDLQDTGVENALRILEEVGKTSFLGAESLSSSPRITLRIIDVPGDQALEIVLEQAGAISVQEGDKIRVQKYSANKS